MRVKIVSVVGRSRCPTTRQIILCKKIVIIIIRKTHASLSLLNMQISHIKHQPFFFLKKKKKRNNKRKKKRKKAAKQRKEKIFFFSLKK
jgi:hypothetical protein